jgi:hypothetical protein
LEIETMSRTATWHGKVIASSSKTLEVGGYRYGSLIEGELNVPHRSDS